MIDPAARSAALKSEILFLGDSFFRTNGKEDPFESVLEDLSSCLIVANCETVIAQEENDNVTSSSRKLISLVSRSSDECRKAIKSVDVFSMANNHTLDLGPDFLEQTVEFLNSEKKTVIGTVKNPYAILDIAGLKVGILGAVGFSGWKYRAYPRMSHSLRLLKAIKDKADFVVIFLHWGTEYADFPSPRQRFLARKLLESGADCIIGHHPHVFQGKECIRGKLVYYSIGNANFGSWQDKYSSWSSISMAVELDLNSRPPVVKEHFFRVAEDHSLLPLEDDEMSLAERRRAELSGCNMELTWFQWGARVCDSFWRREKEALGLVLRRRSVYSILILPYWISRPTNFFLVLCYLLTKVGLLSRNGNDVP